MILSHGSVGKININSYKSVKYVTDIYKSIQVDITQSKATEFNIHLYTSINIGHLNTYKEIKIQINLYQYI